MQIGGGFLFFPIMLMIVFRQNTQSGGLIGFMNWLNFPVGLQRT
jgi:hypothetical protein